MTRLRQISNKEYDKIAAVLKQFLIDTTAPYEMIEPWNIVNQYFFVDESFIWDPIIYLIVGDRKYSLWSHSTIDITDARNIIMYMRIVCRNLLIGPKRKLNA